MREPRILLAVFLLAPACPAQKLVHFPTSDGGLVYAHLYGKGENAVVLAHGGRFNKESWAKQARQLQQNGFRVLAFDFRGYGRSKGPGDNDVMSAPLHLDVLAAVRYLSARGSKTISIIGASLGGGAASRAAVEAKPGEIDRIVLLAGISDVHPERMQGRKLFLIARDDSSGTYRRLPGFQAQYEKARGPKELIVLEGSAHAQFLFDTDQGDHVMREILRFLTAP